MAETVNEEQPSLQQHQKETPNQRIYLVTDGLRSKHTKTGYYYAFKQFLKDGAKTQDLQVLLDYKPKILEEMIIGYVEMLTEKGKAHQTIKLHCAAIFHFFSMNDITLNQRKISRFVPPNESSHRDKKYEMDEIRRILEASDARTKVIVLLMASTGMRLGAIPVLRVGDLTPIPDHNLYQIEVYATSKVERYKTFCTPECKIAIDSYLDYRRACGEKITDDSYLIREMFDANNPFIINRRKVPTEKMIFDALEQALKRSGVNQRPIGLEKGKQRNTMRSHGFRKHVFTMMKKANIEIDNRNALVGHRAARGLNLNYDRTVDFDMLAEYSKAINLLTIDPTQRLQKRVSELETEQSKELEAVKAQLANLVQENAKRRFIKADKDGGFEIDFNKLNKMETEIRDIKTWLKEGGMSTTAHQGFKYRDD